MDQLILPSGGWDFSLITSYFGNEDGKAILQILVGSERAVDKVIWHYDDRSLYTVKSDYWVEKSVEDRACTSDVSLLEAWWKSLWKLVIPLKVKIFIWKACFD